MKESDTIATLEKRKGRWDKVVGGLKFALGGYAFLVLTYLAIQGIVAQQQIASVTQKVNDTIDQVRDSQLANQKTGTENHNKTREYIKCLVTEVLTVPLAQRSTVDLETCTNSVDQNPNTDTSTVTPPQQSTPTPQSSILPPPVAQNNEPRPNEPIATAPPDPPVEDRSLLGRLLGLLGL